MALTRLFRLFRALRSDTDWSLALFTALALAASVACGDNENQPSSRIQSAQGNDFGPMAVIETTGGALARGGIGPVHIDENCVTMTRENGETLMLVWHAAEVRWNDDNREITFSNATGRAEPPVTVRDGDTITVGGESLLSDTPVERDLVWLATPNAACNGEPWAVSSVVKS